MVPIFMHIYLDTLLSILWTRDILLIILWSRDTLLFILWTTEDKWGFFYLYSESMAEVGAKDDKIFC